MKKAARLMSVTAMIFVLFSLAACGSTDVSKDASAKDAQEIESGQPEGNKPPADSAKDSKGAKDLVASLANLPGLADSPDKGSFVDLVKAIDEVYTEGKIKIEVYPFGRSIENVSTGKADFHIPSGRVSGEKEVVDPKQPFRSIEKAFGTFSSVLYSNVNKKITAEMIKDAMKKGGTFPYRIEVLIGSKGAVPFPSTECSNIKEAMEKIKTGRIDAFVDAQEESDEVLKELKIKNIYRSLWCTFDDVIAVANNEHGKEIEKMLDEAMGKLEASGRLKQLYYKIHKPYDNWQPADMGW